MVNSIRKYILILIGSIALILGLIGVFLPVLPTTPFLLLCSLCYIQSSERMYNWLINHKIFGEYIYSYMTHRADKGSIKKRAIIFLWLTLGLSMIMLSNPYLRLLLLAVGIGVSIHLFTLKTLRD